MASAWWLARTRIAWSRGGRAGGDPATDLRGDPVRFLGAGREGLEANRGGRRGHPCGTEPLDDAAADLQPLRVVEPDEPVGRIEDRRVRPIVPAQHHGPGADIALAELQDVVHGGPAERVDRLVVVADHGHVPVTLGERRDQLRLRPVGVLELVDQDVAEPAGDRLPGRGGRPDEAQRQRDLVAEVDAAVGRQEPLVGGIGAGELGLASRLLGHGRDTVIRLAVRSGRLGHASRLPRDPVGVRGVVGRRDVLVLAAAEQRGQRGEEPGRVAERAVRVELELEQVLAQEDHDLGPGQHPHVGRQPELEGVLADQPVAERVERRDRRVRVAVRDELVDADRHLLGRLVGERQGEDLRRPCPPRGDQPGDPPGDHLRLAGPRTGHDEERSGAVGDRPELVRVEAAEECLQPGRFGGPADRRVHDGNQLAPRGQLVERGRLAAGADPRSGHGRRGPGPLRPELQGGRGGRAGRGGGGHVGSIAGRRVT